ncbi:MAG: hypothetical protein KF801_00355 [Cryobacterium sp.]|jgi:hypothetical protein|nr:hypothetical protein [Cryobacterium sp.]
MPRSNRPRRGGHAANREVEDSELQRALYGTLRTESRRGVLWNVQPVSGSSAVKSYVCPGCGLEVPPGQQHTVAWRADGIMGEAADVSARRHWHNHCWKVS